MRESKIEAYFVQQVEAKGALQRKLQYGGRRGASDRLVVWPGFRLGSPVPDVAAKNYAAEVTRRIAAKLPGTAVVHFVELKAPGKKPDGHQEREHKRLRELGCNVYVIDSYEAVDNYVKGRI